MPSEFPQEKGVQFRTSVSFFFFRFFDTHFRFFTFCHVFVFFVHSSVFSFFHFSLFHSSFFHLFLVSHFLFHLFLIFFHSSLLYCFFFFFFIFLSFYFCFFFHFITYFLHLFGLSCFRFFIFHVLFSNVFSFFSFVSSLRCTILLQRQRQSCQACWVARAPKVSLTPSWTVPRQERGDGSAPSSHTVPRGLFCLPLTRLQEMLQFLPVHSPKKPVPSSSQDLCPSADKT